MIGAGFLLWRRRPEDPAAAGRLAIAATMAASPLAWMHYQLVLAPTVLGWRWGILASLGALCLSLPLPFTHGPGPYAVLTAIAYPTGVLIMWIAVAADIFRSSRARSVGRNSV